MESASNNLLSLVNDILDFSKIEAGKMEIIPEDYYLSSVINDIYNMINYRACEKGLNFILKINEEIPDILYGDKVRIQQIMLNLLTNAVKYTDNGSITLTIDIKEKTKEDITLEISVRDTGWGIKEENLSQLFAKFERINVKDNNTIQGTGLGLSITKTLVDMMNGELNVWSEYEKGSVFTVILKQGIKSDETIGDIEKRIKEININNNTEISFIAPEAKVLVVDDTAVNLVLIKNLLKRTQIQVDTAKSGAEAISKVQYGRYIREADAGSKRRPVFLY